MFVRVLWILAHDFGSFVWRCFLLMFRNIYYLVEEDGEWALGTIISDASVQIISFAEDINVRSKCRRAVTHAHDHSVFYYYCCSLFASSRPKVFVCPPV